jgi:hypothetical protein
MSDITLIRGEHAIYTITVTEAGVAVDLTGVIIMRWVMRTVYPAASVIADTDATLTKNIGTGLTLTAPASGQLEIEFTRANTNSLEIGTYVYGLEYIPVGDTDPIVINQGCMNISADVVRGL